ncbi:MAG: AsmA family protein, partial [Steroidobacteraceae bacterium]
MRALRIIGIIFACFIAAIIIAVITIRLIVNPNDYKGRIEQAVKTSTGRELSLPGDIKLSVFPWIAVQLGPASLGNPPGFGSQPFASVRRASLRVRLLPLLRKQLQVGRVEVDGLDLQLLKNAQGHGNWEMSQSGAAPSQPPGSSAVSLQGIAGVVVKDSRVSYQ